MLEPLSKNKKPNNAIENIDVTTMIAGDVTIIVTSSITKNDEIELRYTYNVEVV